MEWKGKSEEEVKEDGGGGEGGREENKSRYQISLGVKGEICLRLGRFGGGGVLLRGGGGGVTIGWGGRGEYP
jgi:hypothetical protein